MTGEPAFWGLPELADPLLGPALGGAQEAELSVNFHIGSGDMSIFDHRLRGQRAATPTTPAFSACSSG